MHLILDCDGILTDGTVVYHEDGTRSKSFHSRDIPAIKRLKERFDVVILTRSTWPGIHAFAHRCGVMCITGVKDKKEWIKENCAGKVVIVTDDIDDLDAVLICEACFYPNNAGTTFKFAVRDLPNCTQVGTGGQGLIEVIETMI